MGEGTSGRVSSAVTLNLGSLCAIGFSRCTDFFAWVKLSGAVTFVSASLSKEKADGGSEALRANAQTGRI